MVLRPISTKNMKRQHLPKRKNRGETKRTFETKFATGIVLPYANVDFYMFFLTYANNVVLSFFITCLFSDNWVVQYIESPINTKQPQPE